MTTEPDYTWALPIAVERLNAAYTAKYGKNNYWNASSNYHSAVITVAKLIAKYEPKPADPAEEPMIEKIARAIAAVEYGDGSNEPHEPFIAQARAALRAVLEGLEPVTDHLLINEGVRIDLYDLTELRKEAGL